jgi:hypothetical protein
MFSTRKALLLILVILYSDKLFAQYHGMNRQIFRTQMNFAMNNNYRWGKANQTDNNFYYTFTVVMKDSSQKEVSSRIYHNKLLNKNYLLVGDDTSGQKIYPEQTIYIMRTDSDNFIGEKHHVVGLPTDSCWMFKVINGPITAYSYLSERVGSDFFDPTTVIALRDGDGAILPLTSDNIKHMISTDNDAMKYFDKKNYYKALMRFNKDMEKAGK